MPEVAPISVTDCGIPAAVYHTGGNYQRNPWFVKAWAGKIYLGNGDMASNSGACLLSYNPATGTSTNELTASDEQIFMFAEINGKLHAPGGDITPGNGTENFYRLDSGGWTKTTNIPFSDHVFRLKEFGGYVWAGGGTTSKNIARSSDYGANWTLLDADCGNYYRCHHLFDFEGDLYGSIDAYAWEYTSSPAFKGALYPVKWNGTSFVKVNTNLCTDTVASAFFFMHRSETVGGKLLYIVGDSPNDGQTRPLFLYTCGSGLSSPTKVTLDTNEVAYDMKQYGGTVYVLTSKPNGSGGYTTRIRTTTDATNFPILFEITTTTFGLSFDILDGKFYIAQGYDITGATTSAEAGRLYEVTVMTDDGFRLTHDSIQGEFSMRYSEGQFLFRDAGSASQMRLGAQTHIAQGWDVTGTAALLDQAGFTICRDEHYWDATETSAGVYTFANFPYINTLKGRTRPIEVLFTADFYAGPGLYDGPNITPYTSTAQTAFGNYAAAVVSHYPQLKAVEVWNEINGGTWTNGTFATDKPGYYKTLCQSVYNAVKAARPEVKVIGGATVLIAAPFWQALKDNGALAYMDACSIHPYDAISTWEGRLAELRSIIGDKELWVTEFGGPDLTPGWFTKAVTILDSFDVHTAILYLLRSDGSFPDWGLYNSSGVPYSVRDAARFMSSKLRNGTGRFRRQTLLDNGLHAYKRRDTWIIWGTGHPVTIGADVTVRDASGKLIAKPATIGSDPIVLEGVKMGRNVVISASPIITSLADDFYSADWSYYARAISGGALTALSQVDNGYYYYKGLPGSYLRIEQVAMHPESAYDAQARYTAPRNIGACTASYSFQVPDMNSNGVAAAILKNGVSVWSQTISPGSPVTGTVSLSLSSGDTADVRVNNNGSTSYDATSVAFSISG